MGFLTTIGNWVVKAIPVAISWVKKAFEIGDKAAAFTTAVKGGIDIYKSTKPKTEHRSDEDYERPEFFSSKAKASNELVIIQKDIDEHRKKLEIIENSNETEHREIQLHIDILELVISASTFERFTGNINLHSSNLQIHLQTIQNTAGLLDDVNRQRVAVKALMGTVNHMINVLNIGNQVERISGVDIDIRPGTISIYKAYEAFENTRKMLLSEVNSFSKAIDEQFERIEKVKLLASKIPGTRAKINKWISASVAPKLQAAKDQTLDLQDDLESIPVLENSFKKQLENMRQEDL